MLLSLQIGSPGRQCCLFYFYRYLEFVRLLDSSVSGKNSLGFSARYSKLLSVALCYFFGKYSEPLLTLL